MRQKSVSFFFSFSRECTLWVSGHVPKLSDSTWNRLHLHCRESSHALLTLDLVYHQTKTLRTLAPRSRVHHCLSARTFANARHARIRRLAPCLRRHLPDDRWFEFVRRIHRRIAENPWIPSGKNGLSNVSLLSALLPARSVSQVRGRETRARSSFPRPSLFLTTCLP